MLKPEPEGRINLTQVYKKLTGEIDQWAKMLDEFGADGKIIIYNEFFKYDRAEQEREHTLQ